IKPGNIIIQDEDRVRIVDFGFACPPGTKAEHIMGTTRYLAPELIRSQPVDERADIYSLGIMAYEMFTGHHPCSEKETMDILMWHIRTDLKDPKKVCPSLPEALANIIIRSSRRDPDARYKDLEQILYDLQPMAEIMGIQPSVRRNPARLNMTGMFLFYHDEHHRLVQRLIKEFGRELEKVGARLKIADFRGIQE
ncbi:MAG: protein kinase, partial [Pseudomonadota bacterium]